MGLVRLWWLRRFIRRNTKPIPFNKATLWKNRLSFAYMFFAWNAFGFVLYMAYTGKSDWAKYYGLKSEEEINMRPAQQWCKTLGIQNAKVYRISGITLVNEYAIEDGEIVDEKATAPSS